MWLKKYTWMSVVVIIYSCVFADSEVQINRNDRYRPGTLVSSSHTLVSPNLNAVVFIPRLSRWSFPSATIWIGLCSVLRPRQHSIGYMGDGFYRSKDPTNSIKVLKEMLQRKKERINN